MVQIILLIRRKFPLHNGPDVISFHGNNLNGLKVRLIVEKSVAISNTSTSIYFVYLCQNNGAFKHTPLIYLKGKGI